MSNEKQLKRYDIDSCKIVEHKYGQYVFYPDYQSLQSERDEYRQRLQENVKSIESMLHHNEVLTKERDRLREAGNELYELITKHRVDGRDIVGIEVAIALSSWESLTRKEGSNEKPSK